MRNDESLSGLSSVFHVSAMVLCYDGKRNLVSQGGTLKRGNVGKDMLIIISTVMSAAVAVTRAGGWVGLPLSIRLQDLHLRRHWESWDEEKGKETRRIERELADYLTLGWVGLECVVP